jgi:hypothetical protein
MPPVRIPEIDRHSFKVPTKTPHDLSIAMIRPIDLCKTPRSSARKRDVDRQN